MIDIAKIVYLVSGAGMSLFYGWKAVDIFVDTRDSFVTEKMRLGAWKWHQRWLNFMGSAVGWLASYYFIFCRFIPSPAFTFKGEDAAIILVALLGMGGFLPFTLSLVPRTLGSIVSLVKKE